MLCCSVTERTNGQKLSHGLFYASLPRFTLSTGYYGLSLNSSQMHPNPFISSFLSAAVEVPAYISIWVALRFCRRKLCLLTTLVFAAASLLFIQLVPEGMITFSSETISNQLRECCSEDLDLLGGWSDFFASCSPDWLLRSKSPRFLPAHNKICHLSLL